MKITNVETLKVEIPLQKPLITAIHKTETVGVVVVRIETDTGLVGENYVFTLNKDRLVVFEAMIRSLSPFLIGQNPMYVEKIWGDMWNDCNPIGQKGISISAISALDTALWDLLGKQAGMPLYQLFGACRDKVKTYASSGLWLSASIDELIEEAHGFIDQGFRSMKLRLGKDNPKEDVARASALRNAIGDDIEILTDANQSLTPRKAISLARQLENLNIGWLEEPVPAHDLTGHARVLDAINIPVASGETDYTRFGMKNILDSGAVDVLMPDLQRIGGLSEYRKTAALASAYNIPISTHIFTEQSLSIAGSCENCISVEHVDWFASIYQEKIEVNEGYIAIPQSPGLGFNLDYDYIEKHLWQ
ncbi:mandelate racemase/muconate lactonizing enzyme family protein [Amphritea sp. 1_MG-2023]|uniref:mandelate racemase/muconate lactonizing enzyme family protein n=1 Tax=Amphritea sp. 1_MG-2023 TaxID=3062670 RepID=UPI0026E3050D|nr:mandelate racemase/muconate lactonizing enzyme family protein [Amphritea sp. 1_MG-2023]MDO6563552.1 mandelate racemase/muconate lactonizing enzyme family protein [Amphritea sp. 1_MG-2023]